MVFLLLDLETTGLDPGRCRVIEVAARLIEPGREIWRFHKLIVPPHRDHEELWDEKALEMHLASGLYEEARMEGIGVDKVDALLHEDLCNSCTNSDKPVLMGNSVHFDRSFMAVHMPKSHGVLHYRQLDVTSVRLWFQLMSGKDPCVDASKKPHRAKEDIEDSLRQATELWRGR